MGGWNARRREGTRDLKENADGPEGHLDEELTLR